MKQMLLLVKQNEANEAVNVNVNVNVNDIYIKKINTKKIKEVWDSFLGKKNSFEKDLEKKLRQKKKEQNRRFNTLKIPTSIICISKHKKFIKNA